MQGRIRCALLGSAVFVIQIRPKSHVWRAGCKKCSQAALNSSTRNSRMVVSSSSASRRISNSRSSTTTPLCCLRILSSCRVMSRSPKNTKIWRPRYAKNRVVQSLTPPPSEPSPRSGRVCPLTPSTWRSSRWCTCGSPTLRFKWIPKMPKRKMTKSQPRSRRRRNKSNNQIYHWRTRSTPLI